MRSPYRVKDELSQGERPCRELVYVARDRETELAPVRAALQIGAFGIVAGAAAAAAGSGALAVGLLLGASTLGLWRWRRSPTAARILFQVDTGVVLVTDERTGRTVVRAPLKELRNVSLDTKSIRKVEPGRDVIPAVQFITSQIGPEIDVARIVLEMAGRSAPIHLTQAFLPHSDSVEWIAKIRVFLRSHGWLPEDERDRPSEPDDQV